MRLAQEQEQTKFFPSLHQRRGGDRGMQSLPEQQQAMSQSYVYHPQGVLAAHGGIDPRLLYEGIQDTCNIGSGRGPTNPGSSGVQHHAHMVQSHQPTTQQYHRQLELQRSESLGGSRVPSTRYPVDSHARFASSRNSVNSANGSATSISVVSNNVVTLSLDNSKSSNTKLPHGLTVQELKEMTKARLQTDPLAPDHPEQTFSAQCSSARVPSPSYLHHQQQLPDVSSRSHMLQNILPGLMLGSHPMRQSYHDQHQTLHMPAGPPGFQSVPSKSSLNSGVVLSDPHTHGSIVQGRDSCQHQQPKHDTWETASVASMNSTIGSEYFGSESANGGTGGDEFSEVSFTRTRSYPSAYGLSNEQDIASSFGTGSSFFDPQSQSLPNRRRACTLSPRPGLLDLHEDRPLGRMSGVPELAIPNYEASNRNSMISPRHPSIESFDNRVRSYSGGTSNEGVHETHFNGSNGQFNRPRTSSAPSITSSYFHSGDSNFQDSGSFSRLFSGDLTNSVVGNALNSSDTCVSAGSEFASVFRSSSSGISQSSVLPRNNTNPWASSVTSTSFATAVSADDEAALAKDLGSMLRLSGTDRNLVGDNFVDKIDPEVSVLLSLRGGSPAGSLNLYSDLGSATLSSPFDPRSFNPNVASNDDGAYRY